MTETLSDATLIGLADVLWRAEIEHTPIDPVTDTHPDVSVAEAYRIQTHNVERRVAAGGVVRGRKVGLTSRRTQQLFGVDEPTFGVLLDDMFVDDGAEIALDELVAPRVEAEIAFRMGADLTGPDVTTDDALAAIAGALPAIEVVDSRVVDWRVRLADTVADNASSARVVLGRRLTPLDELDLRLLGVLFSRNGTPIDSGAGAAVLGHPARCVAWLANTLAGYGAGLRRGELVLPGAMHRMTPVRPGDTYRADFAHLGTVTARFSPASLRERHSRPTARPGGAARATGARSGSTSEAEGISKVLVAAERDATPIAPFTRRNPFLSTDTAYAAQALTVRDRCRAGVRPVGFKLGMTSKVKRDALGIHEPVFGRLTSDMVLPAGEPLPLDGLIHPRAEPELALLIGRPIPADSSADDVLDAVQTVFPAIEVFDSRYAEPFRLPDSVADNAGAARFVLGAAGRRPAELPALPLLGCLFSSPGGFDTAAGGAAMGDPAAAVAWLAGALAARGERIEAGSIVLTGGLTGSVPLRRGDRVTAEFDVLGSVEVRCV